MRPIPRVRKLSALVQFGALALAACGGGGGGDTPAPAPVATAPSSTPSASGPAAPTSPPTVSGPATPAAPSAPAWMAASVGPQVWHSLSTDATGDVIVAGETAEGTQPGRLRLSTDAGSTWTTPDLPAGVWIWSDVSGDGSRIVAVQFQGGMYLSTNRGATWSQVTDPLVNRAGGLKFESVTMSRDGMHLAATIRDASDTQAGPAVGDGSLLLSDNGGTSWTRATLPATTQPKVMRAVDSSADGQVIVAVSQGGDVFRSTNAGGTFSLVPVAVGVPPVATRENWYRVKTSADGRTIALAANSIEAAGPGTGLYVSRDGGTTWARGLGRTGDYTGIAMSDDGTTIAATISNPNPGEADTTPGQVVRSTDAGTTFQPLPMPAGTTDWRALAMSSDGDRLAVAAGFYLTREAGPLYLSSGNRPR